MKRTYKNKKGEIKTYVYDGSKYRTPSTKVITKSGTVSKKIDKMLATIKDEEELEYVKSKIKQYSYSMRSKLTEPKAMDLSSFRNMYAASRVEIFLDNVLNITVMEFIEQLAEKGIIVTEEDVLNNANWDWKGNIGNTGTQGATLRAGSKVVYFVFEYYSHSYEIQVIGE